MTTAEHPLPGPYQTAEADLARTRYASIMEEIKRRIQTIVEMLAGTIPVQPRIIVSETCYLQLRMICELIVLASAVAQGDFSKRESLLKDWHATQLASKLEQLLPNFYPVPGQQVIGLDGKVDRLAPITDGFLSLEALRQLYRECGEHLHVGNLRSVLIDRRPEPTLSQIASWKDKIVRLLNHHQIQLFDEKFQLWTIMHATDGKVHVSLFERIGE